MSDGLADALFLVSGGGRGVTAQCVIALATAHRCRFVLLGRTALDTPPPVLHGIHSGSDADIKAELAAWLRERNEAATPVAIESLFRAVTGRREIHDTIQAVVAAGGRADYLAVDVTDAAALRAALTTSALGEITGIIHGAGVLSDRLIEHKTETDFDRVYDTKVRGLQAMLGCVDPARLRYLALFSSIASFHGNRGQSDYALANEILNKFAHAFKRTYPACHTTVVNWGPWDGGMVAPHLKALFERNGVAVMPLDVGARIFARVLGAPNHDVQLLVNDAPPIVPEPTTGPILPLRIVRSLGEAANPFLADHRIAGHAVLPAACAGVWLANSVQKLHPGYRFGGLTDFRVLKGVVFDDERAHDYAVDVGTGTIVDGALVRSVMISSRTSAGQTRFHYSGSVRLVREIADIPHHASVALAHDERLSAFGPYASGALFHGPAFHGITRVLSLTPSAITSACVRRATPVRVLGQFPADAFDPVCVDLMFQCVGLWVHQQSGAMALPSSVARLDWFRTPPADIPFYISADITEHAVHRVVASVAMHDDAGLLFARVTGAELTISGALARRAHLELAHA